MLSQDIAKVSQKLRNYQSKTKFLKPTLPLVKMYEVCQLATY